MKTKLEDDDDVVITGEPPARPDYDWHLEPPPEHLSRFLLGEGHPIKGVSGHGVAVSLEPCDGGYLLRVTSDDRHAAGSWSRFDGDPIHYERWLSSDELEATPLRVLLQRAFVDHRADRPRVADVVKKQAKSFSPIEIREWPDGTTHIVEDGYLTSCTFASGGKDMVALVRKLAAERALYARLAHERTAKARESGNASGHARGTPVADSIRKYVTAGATSRDIADALGCSVSYVNQVASAMGRAEE